jgi:hypothetical protein
MVNGEFGLLIAGVKPPQPNHTHRMLFGLRCFIGFDEVDQVVLPLDRLGRTLIADLEEDYPLSTRLCEPACILRHSQEWG